MNSMKIFCFNTLKIYIIFILLHLLVPYRGRDCWKFKFDPTDVTDWMSFLSSHTMVYISHNPEDLSADTDDDCPTNIVMEFILDTAMCFLTN